MRLTDDELRMFEAASSAMHLAAIVDVEPTPGFAVAVATLEQAANCLRHRVEKRACERAKENANVD